MNEPGPPADSGPGPPTAVLFLVPVLALVALALAGPILSGDLWWHLHTGEWILDHGALPTVDPFSHTAGETPWILQEYGSQVIFALVLRVAGFFGLKLLGALLGIALLLVVLRTARALVPAAWAVLLTAAFALLFALKWELRPHLFSALLFFALLKLLLRRPVPGWREMLGVLVLSCVWVQLHAEALFAPIVAAAGLCGALLALLLREELGGARLRAWFGLFCAALVGTLLSPLGWSPHHYALVGRAAPQQYIEEWFRPWVLPGDPRFEPMTQGVLIAYGLAIAIGLVFLMGQALPRLRVRSTGIGALPWERIAVLAVCLLMSLQARRFLWLAWFPLLECTAWLLADRQGWRAQRLLPLALGLILVVPLAGTQFANHSLRALWADSRALQDRVGAEPSMAPTRFFAEANVEFFPAGAAWFLGEAGLEGNLFHRYEWGGYLGFEVGNPVFIDGRTVLFEEIIPERWLAEHWKLAGDPAHARETFRKRDVRVLVMPKIVNHGSGPAPWQPPGAGSEWIKVWSDLVAVVWIQGSDHENMQRVRETLSEYGVEFDPRRGFLEAQALAAHPEWHMRRWPLVPAGVWRDIDRTYEHSSNSAPGWSRAWERADSFLRHNMRRNALYELENYIERREMTDAARRSARERLAAIGPAAFFEELRLW